MLKIVKTSLLVLSASLLFSAVAHAEVSNEQQSICSMEKADNKGELRKKMKIVQSDYTIESPNNFNGITCSTESLIRSALISNIIETGTLLVKKLPNVDLGASDKNGLGVYAGTLQKDMTDTAIVSALNDSI